MSGVLAMGYTAKGPKDMKPGTPPKGPAGPTPPKDPAGASSANPRQGEKRHEPEDT